MKQGREAGDEGRVVNTSYYCGSLELPAIGDGEAVGHSRQVFIHQLPSADG